MMIRSTALSVCVGSALLWSCSQGSDPVAGSYASLRQEEASRADLARSIPDPQRRLAALSELADTIVRERALADGLVDREGVLARGVEPASIAARYADVRADLLRGEEEAMRRVEAQVAEQFRPERITHAQHMVDEGRMLEYAEAQVRAAALPRAEEEALLRVVRENFQNEDEQDVVLSEEELNPVPRPGHEEHEGRVHPALRPRGEVEAREEAGR